MPIPYSPLPDWNYSIGEPQARAVFRQQAEDFRVWEMPLVEVEGSGSHLWLELEKRNANTNWVAGQLAQAAGAAARDVGFAGMKDRRGVTSQWFSIALQEADNADWESWNIPDVTILQGKLHGRKLKRGALKGNRFRITLRQVTGEPGELEQRLQQVAEQGVPNYFGPQRFGHGGLNVQRGAHWLTHGGRLPRNKKSIYLSSVRSYLFNQVLSERVGEANWNLLIDGDVAVLDGSRSLFPCELPDPELQGRCAEFDIHPTGPLPGDGGRVLPAGPAEALEQAVLHQDNPLLESLQSQRIESGRRSLRVRPAGLAWQWQGPDSDLVLEFELPPGAYATSVLRELVSTEPGTISDKSGTEGK